MFRKALIVLSLMLAVNVSTAHAYLIDATLTADNHYGLYYGNSTASSLSLVGRNEFGPWGSSGAYNWSVPESYTFDAGLNDYLYVLAWDDQTVTQSWIGQFNSPFFGEILSNTTNWEYMVATGANPGDYGNLPSLATVQSDIAGASWALPLAFTPNGSGPWGFIPGVSSSADFIWHDTLDNASSSDLHYAIYRTKLPTIDIPPGGSPVPEPSTMALFAVGLMACVFLMQRKTQRA